MFLPNPGAWAAGETIGHVPVSQAPNQVLQAQLLGLDMIEMWLQASRRMVDVWRETVRDQQDAFVSGWRDQLERSLLGGVAAVAAEGREPPPDDTRRPPLKNGGADPAQVAQAA